MQSRHGISSRISSLAHASQRVLDIGPGRDDGAQNHQSEREESHWGHGAAEPKHLSVCNQNDCQVFKDGVYGDREKLQRPGTRVDHADEEEGDREPCCC